ncbi:MAG: hypothetical protein KBE65_19605 [Phycisphaerae bacterium]|nr:hypothetical protein [Phycisphaerae bacterium]
MNVARRFVETIVAGLLLTLVSTTSAKYSGGRGVPDDPYQIGTAADLIALGKEPNDYGKHFVLTADIDLDPNLPGGRVFDKAVIAADTNDTQSWHQGTPFTGVFDGNGHRISHLTISGGSFLGLFGLLGSWDTSACEIKDLGLVDVNVAGSGNDVGGLVGYSTPGTSVVSSYSSGSVSGAGDVGGLVGYSGGSITSSHSSGSVSGGSGEYAPVGGLVGYNSGSLTTSHSTSSVSGVSMVGGLVGSNYGSLTMSYSAGSVCGTGWSVGGLVGYNSHTVFRCYSTAATSGNSGVGGLVGENGYYHSSVSLSYSTGPVTGSGESIGGLVGSDWYGGVSSNFWDIQTSGQTTSAGGIGKTTGEMEDMHTYQDAGWDFWGESGDGLHEVWQMPEGGGYPVLAIFNGYVPLQLPGRGTAEDPYRISNAAELGAMYYHDPEAHYRLTASIDLSNIRWGTAVIPFFAGVFDGGDHTISHLTIHGASWVGLFGQLGYGASVANLGLEAVEVSGTGEYIGGLAGSFESAGTISHCHIIGSVHGGSSVGGLMGSSGEYEDGGGDVTDCWSAGVVSGDYNVGGLMGSNGGWVNRSYSTCATTGNSYVGGLIGNNAVYVMGCTASGWVTESYSTGTVNGKESVGGLVGYNESGGITASYSTGPVSGDRYVGGFVGYNYSGEISASYSTGLVTGTEAVGGLVGYNGGSLAMCYSTGSVTGTEDVGGLVGYGWSSGVTSSFWDVQTSGQTTSAGGTGLTTSEMKTARSFSSWASDGVWTIDEGRDYPRLLWENAQGVPLARVYYYGGGSGSQTDPYLVNSADDLRMIGPTLCDWDKHFKLTADIDLSAFDGKDGRPAFNIIGTGYDNPFTGVFDGNGHRISHLTITGEYSVGLFGRLGPGAEVKDLGVVDVNVAGSHYVGGLVGDNDGGRVSRCYSTGKVSGDWCTGGLVGDNGGTVTHCHGAAEVAGGNTVGGLVGSNSGSVAHCYSTGAVHSDGEDVGGLVGRWGGVMHSVWDMETSGLSGSDGGVGLTTAEMMDPYMLGLNGFANDPNWVLDAGRDYPRLVWEGTPGQIIPEPGIDWLEGHGTPEDPYCIDTAEQLVLVGRASVLCDQQFLLRADLDLDPKVAGGRIFAQAVIPAFSGALDGQGHEISHLTIAGSNSLGLFGRLGSRAQIRDLGIADVNITGTGWYAGGLAGDNDGVVIQCYSTGSVDGATAVGGLVGTNSSGSIIASYTAAKVSGTYVGGLVGWNHGTVTHCSSDGEVNSVEWCAGGLVGSHSGNIIAGCSSSAVSGERQVGGLVGQNDGGSIAMSYSTGPVRGNSSVGGLVGSGYDDAVTSGFWDTETSGQATSDGGEGKTTAEMQDMATFLSAGWDLVGEASNGTCDHWDISPGDYPLLRHLGGNRPSMPEGLGTIEQPYLIRDAEDLGAVWFEPLAHYRLACSLDLSGITWSAAVIPWFGGTFDGDSHVISNLHIQGGSELGLFGCSASDASISHLGLEAVEVRGTGGYVGGLAGYNSHGSITATHSSGLASGTRCVGGLVGLNYQGSIAASSSSGSINGTEYVGGLVGRNYEGNITMSCADASVNASEEYSYVGGLVGDNDGGNIATSYSAGAVSGSDRVGGLVGYNSGNIAACYSSASAVGDRNYSVGGLVGLGWPPGTVTSSFWDTQTSGQAESDGGVGLSTAEMQTASTFLNAGWDFMGETANGTEDIWWIDDGKDYPRLWWEQWQIRNPNIEIRDKHE